jgi:hypothetical protein
MFERFKRGLYYDADKAGSGGAGSGSGENQDAATNSDAAKGDGKQPPETLTYENWLTAQPDTVKTLLEVHTKGLKSALDGERDARRAQEKELRDLAGKAEKGSEAEKKLLALADQTAEADRRAEFYEEAHTSGVSDLKLAYLLAVEEELFDKRGRVNFEEMKKAHPVLFGGMKPPAGNADSGTGNPATGKPSMDDFIRRKVSSG